MLRADRRELRNSKGKLGCGWVLVGGMQQKTDTEIAFSLRWGLELAIPCQFPPSSVLCPVSLVICPLDDSQWLFGLVWLCPLGEVGQIAGDWAYYPDHHLIILSLSGPAPLIPPHHGNGFCPQNYKLSFTFSLFCIFDKLIRSDQ